VTRDYYNRRSGQGGERPRLSLEEAAGQLAAAFRFVLQKDYLQRSFGYYCVDQGVVPGREGGDIREALYLDTGIKITGPVDDAISTFDEAALFTLIEYVFDHVAEPRKGSGSFHSYNDCGWHYDFADASDFDEPAARAIWRERVNKILKYYEDGFELSASGEVERLAAVGVSELVTTSLPAATSPTDAQKVAHAIQTFLRGRSTREERKQAVRSLFDVLEFHRQEVTSMMEKDERDLFNIANNFSIRHHRDTQKDEYDDAWLAWMFYVNLATVHLVLGRVHGVRTFPGDAATQVAVKPSGKLVL
jgi:hypothetical protein